VVVVKIIDAVQPEGDFLTLAAFVQRTGVSLRTVYHMIEAGQVRSISFRRRRLIPASELARLNSAAGAYVPYRKSTKAKPSGRR
jgi:excisionase family DNA binding protein